MEEEENKEETMIYNNGKRLLSLYILGWRTKVDMIKDWFIGMVCILLVLATIFAW